MAVSFWLPKVIVILTFCGISCAFDDLLDRVRQSKSNDPEVKAFLKTVLKHKDDFKWIQDTITRNQMEDHVLPLQGLPLKSKRSFYSYKGGYPVYRAYGYRPHRYSGYERPINDAYPYEEESESHFDPGGAERPYGDAMYNRRDVYDDKSSYGDFLDEEEPGADHPMGDRKKREAEDYEFELHQVPANLNKRDQDVEKLLNEKMLLHSILRNNQKPRFRKVFNDVYERNIPSNYDESNWDQIQIFPNGEKGVLYAPGTKYEFKTDDRKRCIDREEEHETLEDFEQKKGNSSIEIPLGEFYFSNPHDILGITKDQQMEQHETAGPNSTCAKIKKQTRIERSIHLDDLLSYPNKRTRKEEEKSIKIKIFDDGRLVKDIKKGDSNSIVLTIKNEKPNIFQTTQKVTTIRNTGDTKVIMDDLSMYSHMLPIYQSIRDDNTLQKIDSIIQRDQASLRLNSQIPYPSKQKKDVYPISEVLRDENANRLYQEISAYASSTQKIRERHIKRSRLHAERDFDSTKKIHAIKQNKQKAYERLNEIGTRLDNRNLRPIDDSDSTSSYEYHPIPVETRTAFVDNNVNAPLTNDTAIQETTTNEYQNRLEDQSEPTSAAEQRELGRINNSFNTPSMEVMTTDKMMIIPFKKSVKLYAADDLDDDIIEANRKFHVKDTNDMIHSSGKSKKSSEPDSSHGVILSNNLKEADAVLDKLKTDLEKSIKYDYSKDKTRSASENTDINNYDDFDDLLSKDNSLKHPSSVYDYDDLKSIQDDNIEIGKELESTNKVKKSKATVKKVGGGESVLETKNQDEEENDAGNHFQLRKLMSENEDNSEDDQLPFRRPRSRKPENQDNDDSLLRTRMSSPEDKLKSSYDAYYDDQSDFVHADQQNVLQESNLNKYSVLDDEELKSDEANDDHSLLQRSMSSRDRLGKGNSNREELESKSLRNQVLGDVMDSEDNNNDSPMRKITTFRHKNEIQEANSNEYEPVIATSKNDDLKKTAQIVSNRADRDEESQQLSTSTNSDPNYLSAVNQQEIEDIEQEVGLRNFKNQIRSNLARRDDISDQIRKHKLSSRGNEYNRNDQQKNNYLGTDNQDRNEVSKLDTQYKDNELNEKTHPGLTDLNKETHQKIRKLMPPHDSPDREQPIVSIDQGNSEYDDSEVYQENFKREIGAPIPLRKLKPYRGDEQNFIPENNDEDNKDHPKFARILHDELYQNTKREIGAPSNYLPQISKLKPYRNDEQSINPANDKEAVDEDNRVTQESPRLLPDLPELPQDTNEHFKGGIESASNLDTYDNLKREINSLQVHKLKPYRVNEQNVTPESNEKSRSDEDNSENQELDTSLHDDLPEVYQETDENFKREIRAPSNHLHGKLTPYRDVKQNIIPVFNRKAVNADNSAKEELATLLKDDLPEVYKETDENSKREIEATSKQLGKLNSNHEDEQNIISETNEKGVDAHEVRNFPDETQRNDQLNENDPDDGLSLSSLESKDGADPFSYYDENNANNLKLEKRMDIVDSNKRKDEVNNVQLSQTHENDPEFDDVQISCSTESEGNLRKFAKLEPISLHNEIFDELNNDRPIDSLQLRKLLSSSNEDEDDLDHFQRISSDDLSNAHIRKLLSSNKERELSGTYSPQMKMESKEHDDLKKRASFSSVEHRLNREFLENDPMKPKPKYLQRASASSKDYYIPQAKLETESKISTIPKRTDDELSDNSQKIAHRRKRSITEFLGMNKDEDYSEDKIDYYDNDPKRKRSETNEENNFHMPKINFLLHSHKLTAKKKAPDPKQKREKSKKQKKDVSKEIPDGMDSRRNLFTNKIDLVKRKRESPEDADESEPPEEATSENPEQDKNKEKVVSAGDNELDIIEKTQAILLHITNPPGAMVEKEAATMKGNIDDNEDPNEKLDENRETQNRNIKVKHINVIKVQDIEKNEDIVGEIMKLVKNYKENERRKLVKPKKVTQGDVRYHRFPSNYGGDEDSSFSHHQHKDKKTHPSSLNMNNCKIKPGSDHYISYHPKRFEQDMQYSIPKVAKEGYAEVEMMSDKDKQTDGSVESNDVDTKRDSDNQENPMKFTPDELQNFQDIVETPRYRRHLTAHGGDDSIYGNTNDAKLLKKYLENFDSEYKDEMRNLNKRHARNDDGDFETADGIYDNLALRKLKNYYYYNPYYYPNLQRFRQQAANPEPKPAEPPKPAAPEAKPAVPEAKPASPEAKPAASPEAKPAAGPEVKPPDASTAKPAAVENVTTLTTVAEKLNASIAASTVAGVSIAANSSESMATVTANVRCEDNKIKACLTNEPTTIKYVEKCHGSDRKHKPHSHDDRHQFEDRDETEREHKLSEKNRQKIKAENLEREKTKEHEHLKNILNGHTILDILDKFHDRLKVNDKLYNRFGRSMGRKCANQQVASIDQFREEQSKKDIKHAQLMLHQVIVMMNKIVADQVHRRSCVILPPELKAYAAKMANIVKSLTKSLEVAEGYPLPQMNAKDNKHPIKPDDKQEDFLFDNPTDGNDEQQFSPHEAMKKKIHLIKKLLQKYEHMSEKCQIKVQPVKEYLQQHLDVLETMEKEKKYNNLDVSASLCTIVPSYLKKCPSANVTTTAPAGVAGTVGNVTAAKNASEAQTSAGTSVATTLAAPHAGRAALRSYYRDGYMNPYLDRNFGKLEHGHAKSLSDKYRKLVEAADTYRRKREIEERIARLFGRARKQGGEDVSKKQEKPDLSSIAFEAPLVYSLDD